MANHELPVALRRLAVRLLLVVATGGGSHSSTFRLNLSALCGTESTFLGCLGGAWGVTGGMKGCLGCMLCQKRLR